MAFRIGLVGLCTSHPGTWVPLIREMVDEGKIDAEIVAAWDSAETRHVGYTQEFCHKFAIPYAVDKLDDMLNMVDGVIVHTANWDRHLQQAEKFVEAHKSVYIDKPIVGNMADANKFLDWMKQGYQVTGGSVMKYCREVREFMAQPESVRGKVWTAYTSVGVDDMNYGIHAYALLSAVFGRGIKSVRYLGSNNQKQLLLCWQNGGMGLLTFGTNAWLPFHLTITTDKNVFQIPIDIEQIYRSMLNQVMPYFTGLTTVPPLPVDEILEPELAAIAAKQSWLNNHVRVFLSDLDANSPNYDGTQFAREYRRARLSPSPHQ